MSPSRRVSEGVPRLTRRPWEDVARDLEEWLKKLYQAWSDGIPPGFLGTVPEDVEAGDSGAAGGTLAGWAAADHEHPVLTGAPLGLANTTAEGTATALPRLDHQHKRDVRVQLEGADVGTRNALNFEDSPSLDFQIADDLGNDQVDVTGVVLGAGIVWPIRTITAGPFFPVTTDRYVLVDATSGAITVTLPAASSNTGRLLTFKKIDSSVNFVTVTGLFIAETIDGDVGFDLEAEDEVIEIVCDGTEWWVV